MNRYWSVAQGYVSWKGNWEGIAPGWKGHANHGYEVPISALATPVARCSPRAVAEFKRIIETLA